MKRSKETRNSHIQAIQLREKLQDDFGQCLVSSNRHNKTQNKSHKLIW